jgi:hypothetical protein
MSSDALIQSAKHGRETIPPTQLNGSTPRAYMHVQRGDLLVGILATTCSATLVAMWAAGPSLLASIALLLKSMTALAFCSSVVEIANGQLSVRYGPGWINRKIAIRDIVSGGIVISPFAYGWGIRRERRGYSWRLSQAAAIELHLRNSRRVRIGTSACGRRSSP